MSELLPNKPLLNIFFIDFSNHIDVYHFILDKGKLNQIRKLLCKKTTLKDEITLLLSFVKESDPDYFIIFGFFGSELQRTIQKIFKEVHFYLFESLKNRECKDWIVKQLKESGRIPLSSNKISYISELYHVTEEEEVYMYTKYALYQLGLT
jgi:hypothetical protein